MSLSTPKYLCLADSLRNASLMERAVVSLICFCSFREYTQAAAGTPWIQAYFPILAR